MFDFLADEPIEVLTGAVYFAARIIVHRRDMPDFREVEPVQGVAAEPTSEQAEMGRRIISTILNVEKKHRVDELTAEQASSYLSELIEIVDNGLCDAGGAASAQVSGQRTLERWREAGRGAPTVRSA